MHTVFILLVAGLLALPVCASTYTVTHNGDAPDANHGDDVCATASCVCTLRAAIEEANSHEGADIVLAGSGAPYVVTPATTLPTIEGPLVVDGVGGGTCGITFGFEIQGNANLSHAISIVGAIVRGVRVSGTFAPSGSSAVMVDGVGSRLACLAVDVVANVGVKFGAGSEDGHLTQSTVTGTAGGDCVQILAAKRVLIQDVTLSLCEDGLYASGPSSGLIISSAATDCTHNGFHIDSSSSGIALYGSTAERNGHHGLFIHDSSYVSAYHNRFVGNERNGIVVNDESSHALLIGNDLGTSTTSMCNADSSLRNEGADTVDAGSLTCPIPPLPGCCEIDGTFGITCVDAATLRWQVTSLHQCEAAIIEKFSGGTMPTATRFNEAGICEGMTTLGTGTCPQ